MSALFELIEFDLGALSEAIRSEDHVSIAELTDIANADFETLFTGRWRQANVVVRIRVDGTLVYIYVRTAAGRLIPIAEKSAGLRQFIALLAFVEQQRSEGDDVVLLIDEAETHLHYDAQADLVNLFTHQGVVDKIIYTTHSAGCLPFDLGTGIRVIEPVGPAEVAAEDWERSRINNAFWTAGPGFSPLLLAMGAGSLAFSALRRAVVGEGITEVILLPTLLREALGRERLDYQIVPGISTVRPADVRELDVSAAELAYVVDADEGGQAHREKLLESGVDEGRIVVLGEGTGEALTVEDLIEPGLYRSAVNRVLERYQRDPISPEAIGDLRRKAAVKTFVEARGEEKPSEREVAQQVLLLAGERRDEDAANATPVLYDVRRDVVVALHSAVSGILGLDA